MLDVVDDGPADSMAAAEHWARLMMGEVPLCAECPDAVKDESASASSSSTGSSAASSSLSHRGAVGRNAELKSALGMPELTYPSYRHGGAKLFGMGEL